MDDRQARIERLVDHFRKPRHRGPMPEADVSMPGGNPGCGDLVTMHLKADDAGRIERVSFEGEGCTISQAAASILAVKVNRERPTLDDAAAITYEEMMELLGREVVGFRERCATLALGTLKMAVRSLQSQRRLRAAGKSEDEIRELMAAARDIGGRSGLVFGADAASAAASDPAS